MNTDKLSSTDIEAKLKFSKPILSDKPVIGMPDDPVPQDVCMYFVNILGITSFMERYAREIKWQKEKKMETNRADSFTEEVRQKWFKNLKEIMIQLNIMNKPEQIWNVDESGFLDETKEDLIVVKKEERETFTKTAGSGKSFTTTLLYINAAGTILPPHIIFKGKNLYNSWCSHGPDGAQYGATDSGWIDTITFVWWFEHVFIKCTTAVDKPILLIMDNHSSHVSVCTIELAMANQITLLLLPPHCTHGLQPLDNTSNNDQQKSFFCMMKQLFQISFTKRQIVSTFAHAGVWPFDDTAMAHKIVKKSIPPYNSAIPSSTPLINNVSTFSTDNIQSAASLTHSSLANHLIPTTIANLLSRNTLSSLSFTNVASSVPLQYTNNLSPVTTSDIGNTTPLQCSTSSLNLLNQSLNPPSPSSSVQNSMLAARSSKRQLVSAPTTRTTGAKRGRRAPSRYSRFNDLDSLFDSDEADTRDTMVNTNALTNIATVTSITPIANNITNVSSTHTSMGLSIESKSAVRTIVKSHFSQHTTIPIPAVRSQKRLDRKFGYIATHASVLHECNINESEKAKKTVKRNLKKKINISGKENQQTVLQAISIPPPTQCTVNLLSHLQA
ncbi:unnamed protein product [Didymodactylos carnosus]|uniref:DDE-1 domain-containing protein n=2 Tax=Didymodactylos carnosus TaxID=1234261 RepID=A0A815W9U7_9BILA|nr:unnamed protein product [Didymodactylos carnosus]CAF4398177.1 unnamed protein product [Didymodactylos carnosus]